MPHRVAMPEDAPAYAPLSGENRSSDATDASPNAAPGSAHPEESSTEHEESSSSGATTGQSKKQQRRYYWTMALLNLLETGAAAGVSKFTPLFLAARGLDVAQVGVVLAVAQVCRFLGGLLFGRVADRTGRFRGVLLGTNLISVALALATTSLVAPWRGLHGWVRVVVLALLTDGYAFFTRPPVHKSSVAVGAPDSPVDSRTGHRRALS